MSNSKHAFSGDSTEKTLNKLRQILKKLEKYVPFATYTSDPFACSISILKLFLESGKIQSIESKHEIILLHETLSVHSYFTSKNESLTNLCDIPVVGLLQLFFQRTNGDIPYGPSVTSSAPSSTSSSSTSSSLMTPSSNYGSDGIPNEEKVRRKMPCLSLKASITM